MKQIMNKNQRQMILLVAFAAGATIFGAVQYAKEIVELSENLIDSNDHLSCFLQGFAVGLNLTSFLMILIIEYLVYRGVKAGKIFSNRLVYFVQIFGLTKIAATLCYAFSQGGATSHESTQIIIGLLIIIFAQIFKIAFRMQQEEELTV